MNSSQLILSQTLEFTKQTFTLQCLKKRQIFYSFIMPSKDQKRKVLMAYSGYGLLLFWILISIFICVDDVYCLQSIVVLTLGVFNAFIWTCGLSNWIALSVRYLTSYQHWLKFPAFLIKNSTVCPKIPTKKLNHKILLSR